jgi:hypothetical protein
MLPPSVGQGLGKGCAVYYIAGISRAVDLSKAFSATSGIFADHSVGWHNPGWLVEIAVQKRLLCRLFATCAAVVFLQACATPTTQIIRTTLDSDVGDTRLTNVLVISVAGNHGERAQVEQGLSAALTTDNTTASPYFAVIGRNPLVTRNTINTAIKSRKFDSVLFVRLQGQDIPELAPGRPTGRSFNLFLYDYEEFNRPADLSPGSTVTLICEIYTAADEKKIWGIESLSFESRNTAEIIELQISSIAEQIKKDRVTAN